jgi:hypothetical protein
MVNRRYDPEIGYYEENYSDGNYHDDSSCLTVDDADRTNDLDTQTRNRPCPTCGASDRLTLEEVILGYRCKDCDNDAEYGGDDGSYDGD